jgi:hypothetical protein
MIDSERNIKREKQRCDTPQNSGNHERKDEPEWVEELTKLLEEIREYQIIPPNPPIKCGICLETIDSASPETTTLPCGHKFDTHCITSWATHTLLTRRTVPCPYCRQIFQTRPPVPRAITTRLLGIHPSDVLASLEQHWRARRHAYWRHGADAATLDYMDTCWLRHRADWLTTVGNGRGVYEAVRWVLGRAPRNAELVEFLANWEERVEEAERRDPEAAAAAVLDVGVLEEFLEWFLDELPGIQRGLRESGYL